MIIKTKFISALALSFLFFIAASPNLEASAAEQKQDRLFLWEVRSDTATVYLLGSIHVFKEEMYPLDHVINEAFEKSDMLVVEVNTANINDEEMNRLMQQKGMYAGGETLEKNLSDETLKLLKEYLKHRGMKLEQINGMKPWLLNLSIDTQEMERCGYDHQHGIDQHFIDKAKDHKTILELETLEEQLVILSAGTMEEQDYSLRLMLDNEPEARNDFYKMINAWTAGDADRLMNLEIERTARYPELKSYINRMLYDRNFKMAEKIKGYLKTDKTYFVAAGAMQAALTFPRTTLMKTP